MDTFIVGVVVFAIYFLPSIIAYNHRNGTSIFFLNLFLGWTFIGWVVALIWCYSEDKKVIVINERVKSDGSVSEEIRNLKNLLDEGILSKDEFEIEKKKLLSKD